MATPTHTTGHGAETHVKTATVNGLAVVGFIALILAGMFLAIYAAGYVPNALSRLASAVYLSPGESQNPGDQPAPSDNEETPSTPVFTPPAVAPTTPATTTTPKPPVVSPNPPRVITTEVPVPLYGLPDLAITSFEAGYMRGSTFVKDDEVPSGRDAALKMTIKNIGTNVASDWRIRVQIDGERDAIGIGSLLRPNGYQTFNLRISNPKESNDFEISVDVDYQDRVNESNERNNDRSIELDTDN